MLSQVIKGIEPYTDKFLKSKQGQHFVLTAPRRFGKTIFLCLCMLKIVLQDRQACGNKSKILVLCRSNEHLAHMQSTWETVYKPVSKGYNAPLIEFQVLTENPINSHYDLIVVDEMDLFDQPILLFNHIANLLTSKYTTFLSAGTMGTRDDIYHHLFENRNDAIHFEQISFQDKVLPDHMSKAKFDFVNNVYESIQSAFEKELGSS